MELIDTHAHLTFPELAGDIAGVVARSIEAGVTGWITIGTEPGEGEKVLEVCGRFENMYAGLGYHPHHAKEVTVADLAKLKDLAQDSKVVAIGETGLDYHYTFSERDVQKEVFRAQLGIAAELNKPAVVHSREAFDDTMEILDEFAGRLKGVVVHCFGGTREQAKMILDRGYYVSFTGIVTFKKAGQTKEAAGLVGLDRMMVETDCPYISPEPVRNTRPCEPAMMVHTAKKLAEIKGMGFEEFAAAVTETSKRFFDLP